MSWKYKFGLQLMIVFRLIVWSIRCQEMVLHLQITCFVWPRLRKSKRKAANPNKEEACRHFCLINSLNVQQKQNRTKLKYYRKDKSINQQFNKRTNTKTQTPDGHSEAINQCMPKYNREYTYRIYSVLYYKKCIA